MRVYKHLLRIWIALASIAAFILGWIGLAHAPKPVQAQSGTTTAITELEPLPTMPTLNQGQQDRTDFTPSFSSPQFSAPSSNPPVFRSRGS